MLYNKNIICISSIDWDFIWQGHQEIMSTLSTNGNRVLFIENTGVRAPTIKDAGRLRHRFLNWKKGYKGIRKLSENLYVYSPLVLPFPYSGISVKINKFLMLSLLRKWMKVMEFHDPIVWSFLPTPLTLNLLDELDPSASIYYCIDDFSSSSKGAKKVKKSEKEVIRRASLVFATSHNLYRRCSALNKETHLFPFGVSIGNYNTARKNSIPVPDEIRGIKRPIIGYVGGVHKWVNVELVKNIALAEKDSSLVVIGPKQTDLCGIDRLDNVFILGKKEPQDLPKFVKFFDVGIIPYRITKYTENVYPTKINEYLAMGKPVISTRIPEVVEFDRENGGDFIYFIENEKDMKGVMEKVVSQAEQARWRDRRISVANENSWPHKIEKMCSLIEHKLEALQSEISENWVKRFSQFYKRTRKKASIIAGLVTLAYLAVFYSPFIWLAASPLEISENPGKADAIVVFGGGVGEGGSPGKSTIERARFSAELYNEGFAETVIYSSGYTWKYNDAENMKLIAMSMGVPEKSIVLDKKGDITYRNVKYTAEILRKNNLKRIILVTSPYNMRRASLVYRKIAGDMDIMYVPVPNPQFYYRHFQMPIRIEQWKAIMHEYGGIIYYFLKGYI